eukprot:s1794_g26.t1
MEVALPTTAASEQLTWWQGILLSLVLIGLLTVTCGFCWLVGKTARWVTKRTEKAPIGEPLKFYRRQGGPNRHLLGQLIGSGITGGQEEGVDSSNTKRESKHPGATITATLRGQYREGYGPQSPASDDGAAQTTRVMEGRGRMKGSSRGDITCLIGRQGTRPLQAEEQVRDKPKELRQHGSMEKAVMIAKLPSFSSAVKKFRGRFFARSSLASRKSKREEVLKLAKAVTRGKPTLPLAKETVESVAAALKEAGMKSGSQYLAELKLLHVEAGYEIEAWLKRTFDLCRKGLERERGPVKRAREVRVETEAVDKLRKICKRKASPQHGGLMFLWACIWMLREIEVRNMKIGDVSWSEQQGWAAIRLRVSKGDQKAEGVRRTLACCGQSPCRDLCPVKLAMAVVSLAKIKTNTMGMPLFTDQHGLFTSKRGVISCWKTLHGKEVSGHSPRRSGAMFYVRRGMAIQELAFLGRWKSGVVLTYAEEALQEKPMGGTTLMPNAMEDKTEVIPKKKPKVAEPPASQKELSLQQAFDKPRNLWVVTKGRGWKGRPRHLVTKASWNLPVKDWSTACGWHFAAHSTEFYFLSGTQVDKAKCTKCQAYAEGATSQGGANSAEATEPLV